MADISNKDLLKKWAALAADDVKVATLAFDNGIYLQASFHCQQAIEKSLKGLIIALQNEEPPYTHDLVRLYKVLENTKFYDSQKMIQFGGINPYYIRSRYPSYKDEISKSLTKRKVQTYIDLTKEVLSWLEVEAT